MRWVQSTTPRAYAWEISSQAVGATTWRTFPQTQRQVGAYGGVLPGGSYTFRVRALSKRGQLSSFSGYCTVNVTIPAFATLNGNALDNRIVGSDWYDVINGLAANDDLEGGAGDDTINGGAGNDTIAGGLGADTIDGGAGNDKIDAFDRAQTDIITCGPGYDSVIADTSDTVASDCERVRRR